MSGLCAGQSMTSTSYCLRMVSRAVWGVALSWACTMFRSKTSVAQGSIWSRRSLMWCWRLRVPYSTISLLPWRIAPHTMTEGPWLPSISWVHASIGPSPCLHCVHDHHCETAWSETHHWRHSASSAWGPISVRSSPQMAVSSVIQSQSGTPGGTPRQITSSQKPSPCSELPTSSEIGGSSPRADDQLEWNDCQWPVALTICLLGLWSDSSDFQVSANAAEQCLSCIAKFCWRIHTTQHSSHF